MVTAGRKEGAAIQRDAQLYVGPNLGAGGQDGLHGPGRVQEVQKVEGDIGTEALGASEINWDLSYETEP